MPRKMGKLPCGICKEKKFKSDLVSGSAVQEPVCGIIRTRYPEWSPDSLVCFSCLNKLRSAHIAEILEAEKGELSNQEQEVVDSLRKEELLARDVNAEFDSRLTLGERVADKVASFGGSWAFITLFGAAIFIWIAINSGLLLARPYDPYPYILLNLVLSCLAAIQAPVIMMSQNRQETKDRLRSENDYRVNLKAELEVRHLNLKMDQLISHQWQRLLELQQIQIDLLEELAERADANQQG